MNTEHLLDAIGLLDDDLVREAEEDSRPRRDYSRWISLAAGFAVVLTLGYGVIQLRNTDMKGGYSGAGEPAESAPPPDGAQAEGNTTSSYEVSGDLEGADSLPLEPTSPGASGDWYFALRVDGTVYRATNEYIHLEPEESDIRYTTSFINSSEPEEDGQANFLPVGSSYVLLDDGTAAVLEDEETNSWRIYNSVPPWEK